MNTLYIDAKRVSFCWGVYFFETIIVDGNAYINESDPMIGVFWKCKFLAFLGNNDSQPAKQPINRPKSTEGHECLFTYYFPF